MAFRLKKFVMLVGLAAVTVLFAHFLVGAYTHHQIVVPGRGSHGRSVTLAAEPGLFWASVIMLGVFCLFSIVGAAMAAWELVAGEELG